MTQNRGMRLAYSRTTTKAAPIGSGHVLEIDGLVRTYGSVRALDGMSFTVRPGAVTGFLGPNGAGKTTTMRAIFGLTPLDAGEVRWQGAPSMPQPVGASATSPRNAGCTRRCASPTSCATSASCAASTRARRRAGRRTWLERLGLADRSRSNLEDLSLGNQQRIQLISALVHEPDVLILDEPFSGLDPIAVDALSKILVSEARRGATVLFSSHQLDLVEHLCEDAVIVDHGRAVTQGPLDELVAGHDPVLLIDVPDDPDAAWTDAPRSRPLHGAQQHQRRRPAERRRRRRGRRRARPAGPRRRPASRAP